MIGPAPICAICTRVDWRKGGPVCTAFPEGIPDAITEGLFDHRRAYPGDGGVRFELAEGKADSLRNWLELHASKAGR